MKIHRLNDHTVQADATLPANIYINDQLDLEKSALDELESFASMPGLSHLSFTPDFHKGSGVPIGTVALCDRVYPRVTGGDIGCGMRFDLTGLREHDLTPERIRHLIPGLRHAFFEGGRQVFSNRRDVLQYAASIHDWDNTHRHVVQDDVPLSPVLESYYNVDSARDNFLGTIGGGNHFVELQVVDELVDKEAAYRLSLTKGSIAVMCHSGSLDLGQAVANVFHDRAKTAHKGKHPDNKLYALNDAQSDAYITASYNAANFATVNRATMARMVAGVLDTDLRPIYDAPHNLVWRTHEGYLHRKGSCPAAEGELVIIPGSMGTRSCLALGLGFGGTLSSSPHGAGRVLNRNAMRKQNDLDQLTVVTKIDLATARSDVKKELEKTLNEEAPRAYKDITAVIDSVTAAGIAQPVAWMRPILTIKG